MLLILPIYFNPLERTTVLGNICYLQMRIPKQTALKKLRINHPSPQPSRQATPEPGAKRLFVELSQEEATWQGSRKQGGACPASHTSCSDHGSPSHGRWRRKRRQQRGKAVVNTGKEPLALHHTLAGTMVLRAKVTGAASQASRLWPTSSYFGAGGRAL